MSDLDFVNNVSIFRKDNPAIIATNRHLAAIIGARMAYSASGYKAGTVVARNTVSGFYQAYNDSASSGLNTAAGVLFNDVDVTDFATASSTRLANVITSGMVWQAKLTGIDANAITDLGGRSIVDAAGDQILIF